MRMGEFFHSKHFFFFNGGGGGGGGGCNKIMKKNSRQPHGTQFLRAIPKHNSDFKYSKKTFYYDI